MVNCFRFACFELQRIPTMLKRFLVVVVVVFGEEGEMNPDRSRSVRKISKSSSAMLGDFHQGGNAVTVLSFLQEDATMF